MADNGKNVTQQEIFIPFPEQRQEQLKKPPECNFSLYFQRMASWKWNNREELDSDDGAIKNFLDKSAESFQCVEKLLSEKHEMLASYAESAKKSGLVCLKITAKTISPFITGLGSGHPTEKGMILDRNIGVPYLPASSIKGVMRLAYALNIANGRSEVPDSDLEKYFGTTDELGRKRKAELKDGEEAKNKRGQLIFLDAYPYPTKETYLKMDIMNPHYGSYYQGGGKEQPVETENPIPIKFLAVKEGSEFNFYCLFRPLETDNAEEIESDVKKMFDTAFKTLGFGGKTAIGYGRFKEVK